MFNIRVSQLLSCSSPGHETHEQKTPCCVLRARTHALTHTISEDTPGRHARTLVPLHYTTLRCTCMITCEEKKKTYSDLPPFLPTHPSEKRHDTLPFLPFLPRSLPSCAWLIRRWKNILTSHLYTASLVLPNRASINRTPSLHYIDSCFTKEMTSFAR